MSATIHNIPVRPTGELFKVPDGYFERFTSELMMKIKQTDAAMQREKGRFRAFSKFYESAPQPYCFSRFCFPTSFMWPFPTTAASPFPQRQCLTI